MWKYVLAVLAVGAVVYYGLGFANKMFNSTVDEIKKGCVAEHHFMLS